jgi:hypothetical protein
MADINYNKGKNTFPKDNIDPKIKKTAKYCKDYAQAAYGVHTRGQDGVRSLRSRDISLLKLYAEGRQPMEKYIDIVCPKGKTEKRQTFMDLSLDPISVIPKFRAIVVGKFLEQHHDIFADAVDEMSGEERRLMKHKLWAKAELDRALQPMKDLINAGVEFDQAQSIIPGSVEELNMMESVGSFKLLWEMGMEMLLQDAFNISDWEIIKQRLYENVFDTAMVATKDYTDLASGKAKVRFVDIERLVVRYSDHKKYDNIDYCGEMMDYTPNQIRTFASEDLPIKVIEQIVNNNENTANYDYDYNNTVDDFYNRHGNTDVKVLDISWITNDIMKQEKRTDDSGETHYNQVPFDYKKKTNGKREILVGQKQMVYRCKWIVGTDYVFNYGPDEDIIRPTKKTVRLPYTIYKLSDKSMLEQIIPHEDGINLAWLNFQNGLAKAAPPGMAIDIDAISNVFDGKNQISPKQVLKIKRETGDLLYSATTHHNQVVNPNSQRPIYDLPGGVGSYLQEQISTIDFNINMIRNITGINEIVDASAPAPNALVQTSQMAVESSNKVLYQMYFAYKTIKEGTASNLAYRIQNIIRYTDYKPYQNVVGMSILEMFKSGSPISHASFGITLRMKLGMEEKALFMQKAHAYQQQGVIRLSDIMKLEHIVEGGSIKQAQLYLSYKEDQYEKLQAQREQERIQLQSQMIKDQQENATRGRMVEEKAKSENKKDEMGAKAFYDVQEYNQKGEIIKEQDDNRSNNKIKEDILKN